MPRVSAVFHIRTPIAPVQRQGGPWHPSRLSALSRWPLLSSHISSAHLSTSSRRTSSLIALSCDVEAWFNLGRKRECVRLMVFPFRYWSCHDRFCFYRLVGIAQAYLAGAIMSGFHNVVIPL